jgi:hypothetical protein
VLAIAAMCAVPAAAEDKRAIAHPSGSGPSCAFQETGQVGVTFNNVMVTKLDRVGAELDQKIDEISALAKQSGIAKIEVQSYSYNVYPVSSGYPNAPGQAIPYQYSGNVSFSVEPSAKAPAPMSLLAEKGYSANLNASAYRQCQ